MFSIVWGPMNWWTNVFFYKASLPRLSRPIAFDPACYGLTSGKCVTRFFAVGLFAVGTLYRKEISAWGHFAVGRFTVRKFLCGRVSVQLFSVSLHVWQLDYLATISFLKISSKFENKIKTSPINMLPYFAKKFYLSKPQYKIFYIYVKKNLGSKYTDKKNHVNF